MRTCIVAAGMLALASLGVMAEDVESPKDVAMGVYRDVFNNHDAAALDRYLAEDFIDHNPDPGQKPGIAGAREFFEGLFAAFPDVNVTPEQVLAEGNFVTVRSTMTGTQHGEFMGMPASHKSFRVTLIDILEVENGRITQRWGLLDAATMMEQLAPASGSSNP